jgi:hypothetical protein
MLFAKAEPKATRNPTATSVAGSASTMLKAAVEAMKRFEGPAKGIRLSPKELNKMTSNSMMDAISQFQLCLLLNLKLNTSL